MLSLHHVSVPLKSIAGITYVFGRGYGGGLGYLFRNPPAVEYRGQSNTGSGYGEGLGIPICMSRNIF